MRPTPFSAGLSATLLLLAAQNAQCQTTTASTLVLSALTYEGCFDTSSPLEDQGSYTYQSTGWCQKVCVKLSKAVMGLKSGSNCWCGDEIPVNSSYVSDSKCNVACDGYDKQMCGGKKAWSVYLTGVDNGVGYYSMSSSSTSAKEQKTSGAGSSKTTHKASVITAAGKTIVVTAASQETSAASSSSSSSHSSNTAGIAAGVVVGVIALAALMGGLFFYFRLRKRKQVEAEYQRQSSLNSYQTQKGSPLSMGDSRLDPSIASYRRQSVGSIADEQDFSRRILKVTNPDGS